MQAAILTGRRAKSAITLAEIDDSVDRIVAGMEGTPMTDGKSKSLVAYHEVGHAVCGTLTPGHDQVQKVALLHPPDRLPLAASLLHLCMPDQTRLLLVLSWRVRCMACIACCVTGAECGCQPHLESMKASSGHIALPESGLRWISWV